MPAHRLPLMLAAALAAGCQNEQQFTPREIEDVEDDYGKWLSMGMSPDGRPVMAYYNVSAGGLGFAIGNPRSDGIVWEHERVDGFIDSAGIDTGDVGQFASLQVSPDGTVWIAYYAMGALRVAHRNDAAWTFEIADAGEGSQPDVGRWASLRLDAANNPVVAHYDSKGGALRVSRRSDAGWTSKVAVQGAPWAGVDAEGNTIERPAGAGQFARLVIAGDKEYIAYHDAATRSLELLEGFPDAYSKSTIYADPLGPLGDVGQWPSMLVRGDRVDVAFEDRGNGDLMVATREGGGGFTAERVDTGEYTGSDTELFASGDGLAVLYFDGRNNDMRLAKQDGAGWTLSTLGGDAGAVGFFNEAVTLRDGRLLVASYDYTNKGLFTREIAP